MNKILAAAAFSFAALAGASAQAAPQISGTAYQETVSATCSGSNNCQVQFTAIAPAMGFKVSRADCRITVPGSVEVFQVTLLSFTSNAIGGRAIIPVTPGRAITSPNDKTFSGSTNDANALFVGSKPTINMYASATTNFSALCTISGNLKPASLW